MCNLESKRIEGKIKNLIFNYEIGKQKVYHYKLEIYQRRLRQLIKQWERIRGSRVKNNAYMEHFLEEQLINNWELI